ncbi:SDR family NAD(P)-dependent oxidoreductase [Tsukamurella sp. 8F]|uniref:SDR family NAD(P)-dependent oxidoreductase n=1 Tax=unclassified Tsukamurella TaxID=2633480 RepID=UPI0023B94162|nr:MULTISPECIES: SDR family NAD(P)-dependent oxidoreductase [unclassified Tsukamurella]MDF0531188.1 SDR family NAD(P)-dependent oxidoreductase [Tsukamurella sp. 8J]MDF0585865.1 SDR family NAD(P)-dependent oxidoreductase [Tsukamurella sp. 8F]
MTVSIVTGAAGGIGRAAALRAAATGPVALLDRDAAGLEATARALRDADGVCRIVEVDLADAGSVESAVAEIERETGPVDALAHCAGVLATGPLIDATPDDWRRLLDVNLLGTVHIITAVGRRMTGRGRGSIVVVGSNAGVSPRVGLGAYGASKAAAHSVALTLGLELAEHGVRVNVVAPGSTDTPMQEAFGGAQAAAVAVAGDLSRHRIGIPLGRIADPDDIAAAIDYLLGPGARHVTTQVLTVDGGATR